MPTDRNVFRIGRVEGDEDQLTELLVWLANAVPDVRAALLELAFGTRVDDVADVVTQHSIAKGRLDALLLSDTTALIIESKIWSVYGDDQIGKYLKWLDNEVGAERKGLMTLTAKKADWSDPDREFADARGIYRAERLWEDLHDALAPAMAGADTLAGQLVREFLEMLSAEELVPTSPLNSAELGTAWADSWSLVRRYREFFHACKDEIGKALDAESVNSSSDRGDWFWQDYTLRDGSRLVVGLYCSDEGEKAPGYVTTRTPEVWMAAEADHLENWPEVSRELEAHPPEGWYVGKKWYGARPSIWRPLPPLIEGLTFEGQRDALAAACSAAASWVSSATEKRQSPAG
jgi:hypothetical protein